MKITRLDRKKRLHPDQTYDIETGRREQVSKNDQAFHCSLFSKKVTRASTTVSAWVRVTSWPAPCTVTSRAFCFVPGGRRLMIRGEYFGGTVVSSVPCISSTRLLANPADAKDLSSPRMGPSRNDEDKAALYPGR